MTLPPTIVQFATANYPQGLVIRVDGVTVYTLPCQPAPKEKGIAYDSMSDYVCE